MTLTVWVWIELVRLDVGLAYWTLVFVLHVLGCPYLPPGLVT